MAFQVRYPKPVLNPGDQEVRLAANDPTLSTAVVDIYRYDPVTMDALANDGIVAVIHKATEGSTYQDNRYEDRRQEAAAAGLLWGPIISRVKATGKLRWRIS